MPWIIPSHQAPALLLKKWRPHWFSGLGLVLGTLTPDLEFIVPVKKGTVISHSLLGQVAFTLPVSIGLYLLISELVWPWLLPYVASLLPDPPALRRPRGAGWWRVGTSVILGGLTHVAIDGFTHAPSDDGWMVALLPPLSRSIAFPLGAAVPLYEVLQHVVSLVLAVTAWQMWLAMIKDGGVWAVRGQGESATLVARSGDGVLRGLVACAVLGATIAVILRREAPANAVEFAAYGALDGIALGMLGAAAASRLQRALRSRFVAWIRIPPPASSTPATSSP